MWYVFACIQSAFPDIQWSDTCPFPVYHDEILPALEHVALKPTPYMFSSRVLCVISDTKYTKPMVGSESMGEK
jgi:hypothetical protein